MFGSDNFQITHGLTIHIGEHTVTGVHYKGEIMDQDPLDRTSIVNADGSKLGFLTMDVTVAGATFEEMEVGYQDLPAKSGQKVTVQDIGTGGTIEVEAADGQAYDASNAAGDILLVTSGTGAISASTAKDTELSCKNGRWYVAQTGDLIFGRMIDAALTPRVAGQIRVKIGILAGGKA